LGGRAGLEPLPGSFEMRLAQVGERLPPLPQPQRLLERRAPGLESLDGGDEFGPGLLIGQVLRRVLAVGHGPSSFSVTVARRLPAARRTLMPSPASAASRRTAPVPASATIA